MVELKAKVDNHNDLRKRLSALGADYVGVFQQRDEYFVVPEGRLKLRTVENTDITELIYYERENALGPKNDDAYILKVKKSEDLKRILKKILKSLIVVEKTREIYMYEGTQIHLDNVKNLGKFIEFERKTSDEPANVKRNQMTLKKLMETLQISSSNLEAYSYSDIIENRT